MVQASVRRGASGQFAGAYGSGSQWSTFAASPGEARATWTVVVSFPATYASWVRSSTRSDRASRKPTVTVKRAPVAFGLSTSTVAWALPGVAQSISRTVASRSAVDGLDELDELDDADDDEIADDDLDE